MTGPKPRRTRTGTIQAVTDAMRAAASAAITWPEEVTKLNGDQAAAADRIFAGILTSRAREDWRPLDIGVAARLANATVEIDAEEVLSRQEGTVVLGGKSGTTPIPNPRILIVQQLQARLTNMTRQLSLFGAGVDARAIRNKAKAEAQAAVVLRKAAGGGDADALLAGCSDDSLIG